MSYNTEYSYGSIITTDDGVDVEVTEIDNSLSCEGCYYETSNTCVVGETLIPCGGKWPFILKEIQSEEVNLKLKKTTAFVRLNLNEDKKMSKYNAPTEENWRGCNEMLINGNSVVATAKAFRLDPEKVGNLYNDLLKNNRIKFNK